MSVFYLRDYFKIKKKLMAIMFTDIQMLCAWDLDVTLPELWDAVSLILQGSGCWPS